MQPMVLNDPAWQMTFPHRVTPKPGEALVSLLLRCDEENHWASGTSCAHLAAVVYTPTNLPDLIVPSCGLVEMVAGLLSQSLEAIAATTYLWELARFFGTQTPSPGDLCYWFVFQACPACVQEQRVLQRGHFLLGMTACQQHQLALRSSCSCGAALKPFDPSSPPFTCSECEQAWGELPRVAATVEDLKKEQEILACYGWWLRYADRAYLEDTLRLLMALDVVSEHKRRAATLSPR